MPRTLVPALGLALFASAMWFAWLGWDHSYYYVDGVAQGPYRAWQAIGCGATISAGAVFTYLRTERRGAVPQLAAAGAVGFAVPWALDASSDETGMWVIGLLLALGGGFLGLLALLSITEGIAGPRRSPFRTLTLCEVIAVGALVLYPLAAIAPLLVAAWVYFRQWRPARREARLSNRP